MTSQPQTIRTSAEHTVKLLPVREQGAHKWSVGGLIVIAGSPTYIGAAALSAMSAGRSGAGIVHVAIPRGAIGAVAALVPEAVLIPLRDGEPGPAARSAIEAIQPKLERSRAMLIGPGLGDDEYVDALLSAIFGFSIVARPASVGFQRRPADAAEIADHGDAIVTAEKPTVVDADGLNWLAKHPGWYERVAPNSLVLTPHAGEMARLLDRPVEEILADPVATAVEASKTWKQTVVLKANETVATDGETVISSEAPVSLATAGSGDVFSGFIAGLAAQGVKPLDAAAIAIYAGVRAAKNLESRLGVRGLVASDLPVAMAEALAALES